MRLIDADIVAKKLKDYFKACIGREEYEVNTVDCNAKIQDIISSQPTASDEELDFLRKWKADVMEEFCRYDASSVEEIARNARNRAIHEFAERLKDVLVGRYANATLTEQYVALQATAWCNEIAEELKGE